MKEFNYTTQTNIDNLVSLWQQAARPFESCFHSEDFSACYVENSDWPNRLWFKQEITPKRVEAAKSQMYSTYNTLVIPYWDINNSNTHQILERAGFIVKSIQIGMSLQLHGWAHKHSRLHIERVTNADQAKSWAEIYPKAFGYRISKEIIIKSHNHIEFYLASYLGEPAGTVMVYHTDDVVGIHGLGIVPQMRRQGFAEEIMDFVLDRAASISASYVTLQSSALGKGLYDKLGFKECFTLKNYILNPDY